MKILVICQHYYPEPFRITDFCEELAKRGHDITVVTATPNYPKGEIYSGYENGLRMDEVINGVNVHRCKTHPRKTGAIHRLWNYYSFPHQSKRYIKSLDDSYDIVFINQLSPVMMAKAGIKYAKRHNKKSILYCLDLWPASLRAGGINGGMIYKWFHMESKKIYNSVDKIIITSKSFADYFDSQFGIKNVEYFPQYAEDTFSPMECKKVPNDYVDLMFAGNVGVAQNVESIIKTAQLCKDITNLRWHIVGDGKSLEGCKSLAKSLDAPVIFHGRKPLEEMPKYYAMADAMLVTMKKDPVVGLTLPGKVQSYMAAGKFIIATDFGEMSDVIKNGNCGICCNTDSPEDFSKSIRKFVSMELSTRLKTESNSRIYYTENFDKIKLIDKFDEIILNCVQN